MQSESTTDNKTKLIIRPEYKGKTIKLSQLKEPGFLDKFFKNAGEYLETK
jgi:hypothetical protein